MPGKIKLKLENENYRDEKCVTQTAWMKRMNKNYKSESIQMISIRMKKNKRMKKRIRIKEVYEWKKRCEWKVYEWKMYTNEKYINWR